jgi:hypothetical protein
LTDICLCHACSYHKIEDGNASGQAGSAGAGLGLHGTAAAEAGEATSTQLPAWLADAEASEAWEAQCRQVRQRVGDLVLSEHS